ncbi:MAG TPA: hypothetical protein VGR16_06990 [Thermomicrobiales bacterium]|nr:hypothetical protein [Thermomicrobiales bacterium]
MARFSVFVPLVAILVLAVTSPKAMHAHMATPAPSSLPEAAAPFGLGKVALPSDAEGVAALFARLPEELDGETRNGVPDRQGERVVASYGPPDAMFGPPLSLQAINFKDGDFFPKDFTAGVFVARVIETADYGAETFGREGNLVWVRAETTAGVACDKPGTPELIRPIYTLAWGEADSPWLFTAASFTPEGLEALVTAFVTTATDAPGTPAPAATPGADATPTALRDG